MKALEETQANQAIEAAIDLFAITRSIESARIQADYTTADLLTKSRTSRFGTGGDSTKLKKIATQFTRKAISAELKGDSDLSKRHYIEGVKKASHILINY